MNNDETQITWNYHNGTKHPNGIFLMRSHFYDISQRPIPYKIYKTLKGIPLPLEKNPTLSALNSISGIIGQNESDDIPTLQSLGRILYFSGGITKTINFAGSGIIIGISLLVLFRWWMIKKRESRKEEKFEE